MLYLKDINLPRPDKYDTCMLIAFLQQLQTFGGFYDENLEFLRLERVHVSGARRQFRSLEAQDELSKRVYTLPALWHGR